MRCCSCGTLRWARALVLFIASLLHAPMEALLKGSRISFGAAAYFCEIVLLTDCFTAKVPHKELFMAHCFGPMYAFCWG